MVSIKLLLVMFELAELPVGRLPAQIDDDRVSASGKESDSFQIKRI